MLVIKTSLSILILGFGLLYSQAAMAHSPLTSNNGPEKISAFISIFLLALFWGIYLTGAKRKPPDALRILCFHAALILCAFAVLGPLDEWAETNEAAHMTQHMLLMVIIAPLWVLSRPLPQMITGGGTIIIWIAKPLLRLTHHPMITAYIHGAVIWFWHLPYFYTLALENPWWHIFEHACFLLSAGLFWWAVLKSTRYRAPWALLAVLFTLMHTGFLGALLTFSPEPLYGASRNLSDQQLAGLIMWVMGALPYLTAAVWIAYRWYLQLQRRMDMQAG
ncbi:MAG: cytochrome c oxidase assembly protein [Pseudomonadota bacterium]